MIDSMNPLSHGYEQGCKVLDALNQMKNAETDFAISKRKKMHNDQLDDDEKKGKGDNFVIGDIGNSLDKRSQDHTLIGERANLIKYKKDMTF